MLRQLFRGLLGAVGFCCLVPSGSTAQSPTTVAVSVELAVDRFKQRLPNIGPSLANMFAAFLGQRVGFLRFAVADTTPAHRLTFVLDRRERGSSAAFAEVGFWIRLERPGDPQIERYWLPVRPADQSTAGVGSEEEFLSEVEAKLVHADAGPLRDEVLRNVPITQLALPQANPPGWALTFRHLDLCIRNNSLLQIVNQLPAGAMWLEKRFEAEVVSEFQVQGQPTPDVLPFLGGVFSQPTTPQSTIELTTSIGQGPVRVKEVFVVSYRHDPNACRHRLP